MGVGVRCVWVLVNYSLCRVCIGMVLLSIHEML